MKKILFIIICLFSFSLSSKAAYNDAFGTYISENGAFFSLNSYPGLSSKGYLFTDFILNDKTFKGAYPSTNFTYGSNGGLLMQCGIPILSNNNYSVTYYFRYAESKKYIHWSYSNWTNRVILSKSVNSNYFIDRIPEISGSTDVWERCENGYCIGAFTVLFKATFESSCVGLAFSTQNHSGNAHDYMFIGYTYENMGASSLSQNDIKNALQSNFNDINNRINDINSALQNSTNSINDNIDDMKEKQDETNTKLDEAEKTRKGILGVIQNVLNGIINLPSLIWEKLKSGFESIVNGLKSVGEFIVNGLVSLGEFIIEGIKSLFIPEDDFFSNYFSELYDFFTDKFGILMYPLDLLIKIVRRFLSLESGRQLITVPDIAIGDFGILIHGFSFYLDEYWHQEPYSYIYGIYKIFVNSLCVIYLVNLAKKKYDEVIKHK